MRHLHRRWVNKKGTRGRSLLLSETQSTSTLTSHGGNKMKEESNPYVRAEEAIILDGQKKKSGKRVRNLMRKGGKKKKRR